MARGGKRDGAGRPKGAKQQITEEALKRAGKGETPLEYMLRVMRDATQADDRRDKMAIGSAPYMHAKAVEVTGADGGPVEFEGLSREIVRPTYTDTDS
jgi:hypothetical protein